MKCLGILTFCLVSCGGSLKQDHSMSVIDAKYPTVEFTACGGLHNGLAVCPIAKGSNFSFQIQGYYQGTVMVSYGDGRESYKREYRDNESININVGEIDHSLVVKLLLTPKYEDQENAPFPISGIEGTLYIKALEYENRTYLAKVPENADYTFHIELPPTGITFADVYFGGCGSKYTNSNYPITNNKISIKLSQLTTITKKDPCVISGGLILGNKGIETTMLVAMYDKHFTPLSIPYININNQYLDISAPEEVSIISLDNDYKLSNNDSFKFDKNHPHVFRALTSAGRTALAVFSAGDSQWTWLL